MEEGKSIRISIRNLVEFILRSGDIDSRHAGPMDRDAMQEGSRIHRKIQGRMGSNYQAEVPLAVEIAGEGYTLKVEGRADGIFREKEENDSRMRGIIWLDADEADGRSAVSPLERMMQEYGNPENDNQITLQLSDGEGGQKVPESGAKAGNQAASESGTVVDNQIMLQPGNCEDNQIMLQPGIDGGDQIELDQDNAAAERKFPGSDSAMDILATQPTDRGTESRKTEADGALAETDHVSLDKVYIDEIKGMYRDVTTLEEPYSLHIAQAKCYAYIYGSQKNLSHIGVQMTYCSLETEEVRRFRKRYTMEELKVWFDDLIRKYQKWAEYQFAWKETRQASIQGLPFPFAWRSGQKDVAGGVYRTILRRKKLFIQAPTGTGKTLSTVYPAVKAVGENLADRIFYSTAKTITRTVAEEAFEILRRTGLQMKTVTLTAKEKICFLEETECNPDACPYAKGHYDRINDAVFDLITCGEQQFNRQTIEAQARKWQVCPFEFGLDVSLWADAVICDYNYIFDPRAKLKRFFGEGVKGDYLFLIDEAHNLVERGREMFSASLYKEDFLELKKEIRPYSQKMARALSRCNNWMLERKRECDGVKVWPDAGMLPVYLTNLCGIMEDFLEESRNMQINEKVMELYFQARRFLDTSDQLNENYVVYTELCEDARFMIKLFCVDISENLQACLDKGRSTIYFSATFLPIHYYKSLLSTLEDDYAIYAEPTFDPMRRQVLIGTDTSSRYTNRSEREYRKMAEYVLEMIRARRGNYMIFFSSYRMMEEVAHQFEQLCEVQGESVTLLCQETGMSEQEREAFLQQFEEVHRNGLAGFCVMGGIFGEGIDLRNDRLIGAVIVGTGLPQVCNEREILKDFYDKRGEDGFFYAYLCPGMNKVLQSAGRVIRTEEDKGIILLLDERFASLRYRKMFPAEWKRLDYCSLKSVQAKADLFWNSTEQKA